MCLRTSRQSSDAGARIALPREPRSVDGGGGEVTSIVGRRKLQGGGRRFQGGGSVIMVGETLYSIIQSGSNNPKTFFSLINKLLKPIDTISTSFTTKKCNSFISFFNYNINRLPSPLFPSHSISSFSSITEKDLSSIVPSMKTYTCVPDPLPSSRHASHRNSFMLGRSVVQIPTPLTYVDVCLDKTLNPKIAPGAVFICV